MKLFFLIVPMLLFAATRQECARMVEAFAPVGKAYDAVIEAEIPSPASEKVIRQFRSEGGKIYKRCKDRMSTTLWYMLGKKISSDKTDIASFHLENVAELTRYAITHPPVVTEVRCGTIQQGIHPLPR
ncbi:hypothetical protein LOH54_11580 [Sulfurimonas sp. HSL-3221]|uniref:hypothetical protein n=1 Tax=Sulfurimonadaceae TaxID=2771471 RepID=UPI001E44B065|nr:hypothetical protein [Sulfurimonas sp. HSL-3221]UFS62278.1 hypothetical protein LOH54_11580 [Sulfurimonas sp. HSL-3221]